MISDGNFGEAATEVLTVEVVPLVEATTRADDVGVALELELKIAGAVEVEVLTPNAEAVTLETATVDDLFEKENPVPKEAVVAVLPTPNPVKDDPPLAAEDAAPVEATGVAEALAAAEDAAPVAPNAGTEGAKVVLPVDTVEAVVVVVTVENSGAEDVVNEKVEPEEGLEAAGVPEAVEAAEEAEAEAALGNPKEG